jgi:hypothetical protein
MTPPAAASLPVDPTAALIKLVTKSLMVIGLSFPPLFGQ